MLGYPRRLARDSHGKRGRINEKIGEEGGREERRRERVPDSQSESMYPIGLCKYGNGSCRNRKACTNVYM